MTTRTFVDIHVLQTVPPSNLNRDDAGSPKQAVYGGVRRARVSSQAWKRAARCAFADSVPGEELATRTRKIAALLAGRIAVRTGLEADASARLATFMLKPLGISAGNKAGNTAYLLFFGRPQLERMVDLIAGQATELAAMGDDALDKAVANLGIAQILASGHPIDVALFGRMVADIPGLNVDAATQVAHAISTHAVDTEFDYFTAVDDENLAGETGAGMIGTVEFNSATLYRFATVGLHQLAENLGGEAAATVSALGTFLRTFVSSMPAGHQNSFAHHTAPSLVAVAFREGQPVNLVTAFEQPVRPDGRGIARESAIRLAEELRRCSDLWGLEPLTVMSTYQADGDGTALAGLGPAMPFADLVTTAMNTARARLSGELA